MTQFSDYILDLTPNRLLIDDTLLAHWLYFDEPYLSRFHYRIQDKQVRFWKESNRKPVTTTIETITEEMRRFNEFRKWNYVADPLKDMRYLELVKPDTNPKHPYLKDLAYPIRITKKGVRLPTYGELLTYIPKPYPYN